MAGRLHGLEGRARRLGWDPARGGRRRLHLQARWEEPVRPHGRGRARPDVRARGRPVRQLVEPGALRQADRPAMGPRDRPREPSVRVRDLRDLPPDLPLRVPVRDRGGSPAARPRPLHPLQTAGAFRPLRHALHIRPLLRGAAADRPVARARPAAPQRLGLDRRLRPGHGVLRLLAAAPRQAAPPLRLRRERARQAPKDAPAMAIPKGRVRPPR